jgi:hypothetical protein
METPAGWQMREHHIGTSYLGSSDPFLHFGTAGATVISQLYVRWPSGLAEVYENVATGQVLTLVEGDGVPAAAPPEGGPMALRASLQVVPNPVRSTAEFRLRLAAEESWISIVDAAGREMRSFRVRGLPGEEVGIPWDVRSANETRLAAGRYFVIARTGSDRIRSSVTVLR